MYISFSHRQCFRVCFFFFRVSCMIRSVLRLSEQISLNKYEVMHIKKTDMFSK